MAQWTDATGTRQVRTTGDPLADRIALEAALPNLQAHLTPEGRFVRVLADMRILQERAERNQ